MMFGSQKLDFYKKDDDQETFILEEPSRINVGSAQANNLKPESKWLGQEKVNKLVEAGKKKAKALENSLRKKYEEVAKKGIKWGIGTLVAGIGGLVLFGWGMAICGGIGVAIGGVVATAKTIYANFGVVGIVASVAGILSGAVFGWAGYKMAKWLGAPNWLAWLIAIAICVYSCFDLYFLLQKWGILPKKNKDEMRKFTHFVLGQFGLLVCPMLAGFGLSKLMNAHGIVIPLLPNWVAKYSANLGGLLCALVLYPISIWMSLKWTKKVKDQFPILEKAKLKVADLKQRLGISKVWTQKQIFWFSSGIGGLVILVALGFAGFKKKNEGLGDDASQIGADDNEIK